MTRNTALRDDRRPGNAQASNGKNGQCVSSKERGKFAQIGTEDPKCSAAAPRLRLRSYSCARLLLNLSAGKSPHRGRFRRVSRAALDLFSLPNWGYS